MSSSSDRRLSFRKPDPDLRPASRGRPISLRRSSSTTSRQRPRGSWPIATLDADPPEADRLVQAEARRVVEHHAGEKRPEPGRLGRRDERLEERPPDPPPARLRADVDALPGDAAVDRPRRVVAERRPAERPGPAPLARDQAALGRVRTIEMVPVRGPRARASRHRSRCPRRRCAGPPASRRRSSARSASSVSRSRGTDAGLPEAACIGRPAGAGRPRRASNVDGLEQRLEQGAARRDHRRRRRSRVTAGRPQRHRR